MKVIPLNLYDPDNPAHEGLMPVKALPFPRSTVLALAYYS